MRDSVCIDETSWPDMAAFCWKFCMSMAACSTSKGCGPSVKLSRVVSSRSGTLLELLPFALPFCDDEDCEALLPVLRRLASLWSGSPPSLAWTVRSCRSSRSRRTKVLRHFWHLKGRSLVSAAMVTCQRAG